MFGLTVVKYTLATFTHCLNHLCFILECAQACVFFFFSLSPSIQPLYRMRKQVMTTLPPRAFSKLEHLNMSSSAVMTPEDIQVQKSHPHSPLLQMLGGLPLWPLLSPAGERESERYLESNMSWYKGKGYDTC